MVWAFMYYKDEFRNYWMVVVGLLASWIVLG